MADDIKVPKSTEPTDPDVATDEVGGRHYQWIKPAFGDNGEATPVSEATPMPVAASQLPLPAGAATEATVSGLLTNEQLRAEELPVSDEKAGSLLWRILNALLSPLGFDKSLSRYRQTTIIESGTITTVTTVNGVTTVATVTGLTNIDGRNGSMLINNQNATAWALNVRARIT